MIRGTIVAAALLAPLALAGCNGGGPGITGSLGTVAAVAPAPVVTPESRLKTLAWNSAWAEACGFNISTTKLKAAYLNYEASNGTPPQTVTSLGTTFDRLYKPFRAVAAEHADQCSELRLERIRGAVARYLANDFSSDAAV